MLSRSGKSEPVLARSGKAVQPVLDSPGLSSGVLDCGPIGPGGEETKVEAMTRVFNELLTAGRTPNHLELARATGADVSHARRVHRRLVAQQSVESPNCPGRKRPGQFALGLRTSVEAASRQNCSPRRRSGCRSRRDLPDGHQRYERTCTCRRTVQVRAHRLG